MLDLATHMQQFEIAPEIEIFDLSHIHGAKRLIDAGLMSPRPHVQFVMGVQNALPADEHLLDILLLETRRVIPGATWTAAGIGRHQSQVMEWTVQRGANAVRTGMEDNIRIGKDRLASGNAETRKHRGTFDPKAWLQAGDTGRGAHRAWPSRGPVIGGRLRVEHRESRNVTSDLIGSGSFQRSRLMKTTA